jgi:tetratricopeptide (TPR) repeat protein
MIQGSKVATPVVMSGSGQHRGTALWIVLVLVLLTILLWRDLLKVTAGLLILSAQSPQQTGDLYKTQVQLGRAELLAPDLPHLSSQRLYVNMDLLGGSGATMRFSDEETLTTSAYSPGLNNAAVLTFSAGNFAASKAMLERAARLNPDSAQAHYNLGVVSYHLGDMDSALIAFRSASLLVPDWPQPHAYLAAILIQTDDLTAAIEAARASIALDPTIRPAQIALLYAHLMRQNIEEGLLAVDQALQEFPQDPVFLLYKSLFLRSKGAEEQAFALLQQAFFIHQDEDQRRRIAQEVLSIMKGE